MLLNWQSKTFHDIYKTLILLNYMNKKGFSLSGLSASAVSVLVAFFMISTDKGWWGFMFIILAVVLAIIAADNK